MTKQETTTLLYIFQRSWPTFQLEPNDRGIPGTAEVWWQTLKDCSLVNARAALSDFQTQANRTFAPTLSEFFGLVRNYEEDEARQKRILSEFKDSSKTEDETEKYSYTTGQTNSKGDLVNYFAVRCSPSRKAKIDTEMRERGYKKIKVDIGNPKIFGYVWR